MTDHPVIDLGSNLEENLQRWSRALRGGGSKLTVFNIIYSGKRRLWTARGIAAASKGALSSKRATEAGKRLAGDGLIRQVPKAWPVVYEKLPNVHHYKRRILAYVKDRKRREALPTKRKSTITIRMRAQVPKTHRAIEITVDDIDQFSRVRKHAGGPGVSKALPEKTFKKGLKKIFRESGVFPDWGGETNDFFTNKLRIKGRRYSAAFALKGPGVGVSTMAPGKWGKRGNQIQKLVDTPAQIFILQFEGQIDEDSRTQLRKLTALKAREEGDSFYYGFIDRDDSLRLRKAYPNYFRP